MIIFHDSKNGGYFETKSVADLETDAYDTQTCS